MKNNKICCDVCACVHNERGCDCCLDEVEVSTGDNLKHHFCKSYECKPEYKEPDISYNAEQENFDE